MEPFFISDRIPIQSNSNYINIKQLSKYNCDETDYQKC